MKARAATRLPALFSLIGLPLVASCTSLPPADGDQVSIDAYPLSPLKIEGPVHYPGTAVNEPEVAMTSLTLNVMIEPESVASGTPTQDHAVNITAMYITYSDTHDLYTLKSGEYALSWQEGHRGQRRAQTGRDCGTDTAPPATHTREYQRPY